ncbi:hypothetical protein OROHE_026581 [Orobanche hederae]
MTGVFYLRNYRYTFLCSFVLLLSIGLLVLLIYLTEHLTRLSNSKKDPPVAIFPGPLSSHASSVVARVPVDCEIVSFSYYRDLKFDFASDLNPKGRIWTEPWMEPFFHKPCNYELSVKPTSGIVMAREAGMEWIIYLDTDELMYPSGSREYSVREILSDVPKDVDMVVTENLDHLEKETYIANYKEVYHGNPDYFLTYGNGKSAARVQDHIRLNGAHRWHNYMKSPKYGDFCNIIYLFGIMGVFAEKKVILSFRRENK